MLPVHTTPEAEIQIREIDGWWRRNRPAATELFLDELADAFVVVGNAPQLGRLYRRSPVHAVRRILLKRTRYHVYYLPHSNEIHILAVWHAQRGKGPPLRA